MNFYSIAILLPLAVLASWMISLAHWANLATFTSQSTSLWILASFCFIFMILFSVWEEEDRGIVLYIIPLHIFLQYWIPIAASGTFRFLRGNGKHNWDKTPHKYSTNAFNGGSYETGERVRFSWRDGLFILITFIILLLMLLSKAPLLSPLVGA